MTTHRSTPSGTTTLHPDHRTTISRTDLDDLAARVRAARLPRVPEAVAQRGVPLATVRSLLQHWREDFSWSEIEERINALPQVVMERADGTRLFAVHTRSAGSGIPVVLLHGWADTFYSQLATAERLSRAGHDVVVPSLPGFAFSDHAPGPATAAASAAAVHELMSLLGHERYAVHGGDWGSAVAHTLMTTYPDSVAAAHLIDIPYYLHFFTAREDLEPHERAFLDAAEARQEEPQYYRLQAGQPLTLSYGMADSPVALLTWLTALYSAWTDQELDADTVLAQVGLYWLTNTFHSSVRLYSEAMDAWDDADDAWSDGTDGTHDSDSSAWSDSSDSSDSGATSATVERPPIPTAFAIHPADIVVPTRSYAERYFDVERFTLMSEGGHFAAMEVSGALADDIATFLAGR